MAALLRMVDGVQRKELGRETGKMSSAMEQTSQPKYQRRGEEKIIKIGSVVK